MRVTMILPISYGGIVHYTANLANSLAKYIDVSVIKPKDQNDSLFNSKVDVYPLFDLTRLKPNLKYIISPKLLDILCSYASKYRNVNSIIENIAPNIVHFTGGIYPHTISIYKNLMLKVLKDELAIVTTVHGVVSGHDIIRSIKCKNFEECIYYLIINAVNKLSFFLVRNYIISRGNFFITHTYSDKLKLMNYGVNARNVYIVPHGFGKISSKYESNRKTRIANENDKYNKNKYVLFFGYIKENKGIDNLIQAGNIVQDIYKDNNVTITIAGEGNIKKYFKLIKSNHIFQIINRYISDEHVSELFNKAELVVLPYTHHGGHSGVLTLALSYGKPVVVTNVGDLPELVKNGKEGFIVPPKDPEALANAIIKILEDDKLRKKMSRNALKKAEELSWDRIAKMHVKVYEEVLEEWKSRRV